MASEILDRYFFMQILYSEQYLRASENFTGLSNRENLVTSKEIHNSEFIYSYFHGSSDFYYSKAFLEILKRELLFVDANSMNEVCWTDSLKEISQDFLETCPKNYRNDGFSYLYKWDDLWKLKNPAETDHITNENNNRGRNESSRIINNEEFKDADEFKDNSCCVFSQMSVIVELQLFLRGTTVN